MGYIEDAREDTVRLKREVRKKILALRDSIPTVDKVQYDASIRNIVMEMEEYSESKVILAYASYRSEVDTLVLIGQALADGKHVFAPKVSGNEMEFWKISAMEDLREGYRGIREPVQSVPFPDWLKERCSIADIDTVMNKDIAENYTREFCKIAMWMPGAAFDKERHRIGYGGGFYDRYLNRLSCASGQMASSEQQGLFIGHLTLTTTALAYHCQLLERIPHEEHDRKPDLLITEQGIYT